MSNDKYKNEKSLENCQILEFNFKNDDEYKTYIQDLILNNPCNYSRMLQTKKYEKIANWVYDKTNFITENWLSFNSRIYMSLHDINTLPACKTCHKKLKKNITNINAGFPEYCNAKCANLNDEVRNKIKNTCIERYGTAAVSAIPEVRQKIKNTCIERYGVDSASKLKSTIDKVKKTKLERYGDETYNNIEKNKSTCMARYNVEYSTQTDKMKNASRKTCLERYGVPNAGGAEVVLNKIRQINIERHGVEYPQQNAEISEKRKQTCLKKFGVTSAYLQEHVKKLNGERIKRKSYENFILNNAYDIPCFSVDEYINRTGIDEIFKFKCKKCGNIFESTHINGTHSKCPICFPAFCGTSNEEHELFDFIRNNVDCEVRQNVRNIIDPYELDIYIPEKRIAFEFDGIFWHSLQYKDKAYHLMKTLKCEELGIQLIHIFENEWLYKQEIVKSRILNALGKPKTRVFARNCVVMEISGKTSYEFQEKNHIQGGVRSPINIGLFFDDDLYAVMTFSKPRFLKNCEYELVRFCTKLNASIIGAAGKMLKYFEKRYSPTSIISYADRRWSAGNLYYKLGFTRLRDSTPNIWYFKHGSTELKSRINFQKHKLHEILENFNPKQTELENMLNNGFNGIYDCGNIVFKKEY